MDPQKRLSVTFMNSFKASNKQQLVVEKVMLLKKKAINCDVNTFCLFMSQFGTKPFSSIVGKVLLSRVIVMQMNF